ncbi:MAG TPA: RNA-directed DNA polymerase [Desulfomonilia bacterium]
MNDAVSLAVDSILRDGCSDITSESLELKLIAAFRTDFEKDIKSKLNRGSVSEMEFRPLQYILTPKNRYVFDYRKAAIMSPACLAKFLAIVFQYAEIVEASRVPLKDNVVFSYRFNPNNEGVFDRTIGYSQWKEQTKIKAADSKCKFIVSCDIAAFYDRVNIHRIESTLLSIDVPKHLVKHTNDLLLFWSKKDSYGIPVGNVASRILAEVALIDIDQYLLSEGIVFTRYVDDYRLFAPSLLTAQEWMNKLTTRLFRDGLMLNTGKTQIREAIPGTKEVDSETEILEDSAETVLKAITKLTGGYNRIVRRFTMPAEEKHKNFKSIRLDEEIASLSKQSIVEFEGIQKVVIASLIQQRFDALINIARVCSSYLYGLDYFIDMLVKNSEFIPEVQRNEIADLYEALINGGDLYSFEWHCASVAKLLSHPHYFRKNALIQLYKTPAKDVSTYGSMIALEGLQGMINRSEFKTIREYFDRSDEWERRRLISLSDVLPLEERKAWVKVVKASLSDDFLGKQFCETIIREQSI